MMGVELAEIWDGVAVGPPEERSLGTGVLLIRAQDRDGKWMAMVIHVQNKKITDIESYPIVKPTKRVIAPSDKRGPAC